MVGWLVFPPYETWYDGSFGWNFMAFSFSVRELQTCVQLNLICRKTEYPVYQRKCGIFKIIRPKNVRKWFGRCNKRLLNDSKWANNSRAVSRHSKKAIIHWDLKTVIEYLRNIAKKKTLNRPNFVTILQGKIPLFLCLFWEDELNWIISFVTRKYESTLPSVGFLFVSLASRLTFRCETPCIIQNIDSIQRIKWWRSNEFNKIIGKQFIKS